jgi:hypothetical protein
MAEQSREEESERNAPQNIPTQDAGWRTGKSETTLCKPTPIQFLGERYPRYLSSLDEGSSALSDLLTPSPPTEFFLTLQPS